MNSYQISDMLEREFEMEIAWIGTDEDFDYEAEYGKWLEGKIRHNPELLYRLIDEITQTHTKETEQ